jgi:diguanylate cyclase (GGDEF)-like protein
MTKAHFELSDKYIPLFRLTVSVVFIIVAITFRIIDIRRPGNIIFLSCYLIFALVLAVFNKFRKHIAYKYPVALAGFDMLLISYGITISGGPHNSPLYLFYLMFIVYFAIVCNMKLTLVISCIGSLLYAGTLLVTQESFVINDTIILLFFYAFGFFSGIISENLKKYNIKMATQDHLTHLYNRQYLSGELEDILLQCQKSDNLMSLIIFDVDDFKSINDFEGHLEGDRVLAEIAELIRQIIRSGDIAARYGGDEFILVLPQTDKNGAETICHRLKTSIQEYFLTKVNVSAGVATYPHDGKTTKELFYAADIAMYKEKEISKSRIHDFD